MTENADLECFSPNEEKCGRRRIFGKGSFSEFFTENSRFPVSDPTNPVKTNDLS
jgi:hypothetical protein